MELDRVLVKSSRVHVGPENFTRSADAGSTVFGASGYHTCGYAVMHQFLEEATRSLIWVWALGSWRCGSARMQDAASFKRRDCGRKSTACLKYIKCTILGPVRALYKP